MLEISTRMWWVCALLEFSHSISDVDKPVQLGIAVVIEHSTDVAVAVETNQKLELITQIKIISTCAIASCSSTRNRSNP
jgi:hypothetical protein